MSAGQSQDTSRQRVGLPDLTSEFHFSMGGRALIAKPWLAGRCGALLFACHCH
jgi:hypothetical protein